MFCVECEFYDEEFQQCAYPIDMILPCECDSIYCYWWEDEEYYEDY